MAPGFLQANLIVVPKRYAFDFLMFTLRNPKPCPLLDVVVGGKSESRLGKDSDLKRDLPKYRVWRAGQVVDEPSDVSNVWPEDAVSFLLGCSFTFEMALRNTGLLAKTSNSVPMYRTKVDNVQSGIFKGQVVVSMRMFRKQDVEEAKRITEAHPLSHGGPVAMGWAGQQELGIEDLSKPDFGEVPSINPDLVPLFWACGVTPQTAIADAKEALDGTVITHAPGCMFITDISAQ
jgi:uncharacterized protein YcsI (UPF0317 family)